MASLEEQVGALVRHHRKRRGLTQAQLAERIDRQTGAVTRIETGEAAPSFETLSKLAEVLEVDVRDFFGVSHFAAKEGRDDPLVRLVERVAPLDVAQLDWIDGVVAAVLTKPKR